MSTRSLFVLIIAFLVTACSEAQTIQRRYAGVVQTEVAANVSTAAVWAVYRSKDFPRLLVQLMPTIFQDIEYVSGDGSVGTILRIIPQPGVPGGIQLVNLTVVDDKTQTRVISFLTLGKSNSLIQEVVQGIQHLNQGAEPDQGGLLYNRFPVFESRYKIIAKGGFCVIRTSFIFQVNSGFQNLASDIRPNYRTSDAIFKYIARQEAS